MPDDGTHARAGDATLRLMIDANALAVRAGLRRMLADVPLRHLSEDARGTAEIVLAEVLNNIVEHAYARWPGTIDLTLRPGPRSLLCEVEDSGLPMPDEALPAGAAPATASAAQDLPEGGFGWHLILSLSLDPEYRRIGDRNRLTFGLPTDPA